MKIIGHRGACGLVPENTLKSILKAIEHHVDEVEFDVRVTLDRIPILHHDKELVDASGNRLPIAGTNLSVLIEHNSDIALFSDVFESINHQAKLLIEVKPSVNIDPVLKVIESKLKAGWTSDEITLTSFDFKLLTRIHQALPEIATQVIESWSGVRAHLRMLKLG